MIRERLAARFPDDALTGEEYAASGGKGPRRWSIDPIDGTGNLVHGLPLWSISIGLIVARRADAGRDCHPAARRAVLGSQRGRRLARRREASRTGRRNFSRSGQRLRLDKRAPLTVDPRSLPGRLRDLGSACCEQSFVAANRLQASILLGEHEHDIAAGVVITSEAGCEFGNLAGERLTPIGNDPPHTNQNPNIHRGPPAIWQRSKPWRDGSKCYDAKNDTTRQLTTDNCQRTNGLLGSQKLRERRLRAMPSMRGLISVHGALYEELMDDRNPLSFEQVQARLASTQTLEAAIAALRKSLALEDPPEEWDETARLALAGIVVRHAELGVAIPRVWLDRAIDWLRK